jgi:hypothetical protein
MGIFSKILIRSKDVLSVVEGILERVEKVEKLAGEVSQEHRRGACIAVTVIADELVERDIISRDIYDVVQRRLGKWYEDWNSQ